MLAFLNSRFNPKERGPKLSKQQKLSANIFKSLQLKFDEFKIKFVALNIKRF